MTVTDERPYELRRRAARRRGSTTSGWSTRPASDDATVRDEFLATFGPCGAARSRTTASTASCCWPASPPTQLTVLRAYAKYLRQIGLAFSQRYVEETLAAHPDIAKQLVELFVARFDPRLRRQPGPRVGRHRGRDHRPPSTGWRASTRTASSAPSSASCMATMRTNAYRPRPPARRRPCSRSSSTRPWCPICRCPDRRFEIWVYSPRVEGVHLRGGAVARGGIRWSDRREDFRTEVLGLMKAQMVKNAVIVPTGAKGGFVVKRPRRRSRGAAGRGRALLPRVHRRSARRHRQHRRRRRRAARPTSSATTATIPTSWWPPTRARPRSPTSPTTSPRSYGFWLGDAFASGGSEGYDHKRMGITARGAWESVRRHFRNARASTPTPPTITVVGIGDMSGDVFGNGMLLSPHLQAGRGLRPPPRLPRSRSRSGGGLGRAQAAVRPAALVVGRLRPAARSRPAAACGPARPSRSPLSDEVRARLGIDGRHARRRTSCVSAILRGARRPAVERRHRHVREGVHRDERRRRRPGQRRACGSTAPTLRCQVVGEGGNLGLTQRGARRVRAAPAGSSTPTPSTTRPASTPPTTR